MKRQIAYDEETLTSRINYLVSLLHSMDSNINMMEEQAIELRDNLDWKSLSVSLRTELEKTKEIINELGVIEIKFEPCLQNSYRCFSYHHMNQIQDRFANIALDDGDLY